jgi:hypothetical protein
LDRDETPFFGVSRKRRREKKAEKNAVLRSAGFEVGEGARVEGGWPKYYVGLKDCALVVRFGSADFGNIERTAP